MNRIVLSADTFLLGETNLPLVDKLGSVFSVLICSVLVSSLATINYMGLHRIKSLITLDQFFTLHTKRDNSSRVSAFFFFPSFLTSFYVLSQISFHLGSLF